MHRLHITCLIFFMMCCVCFIGNAQPRHHGEAYVKGDSIMNQVMRFSKLFSGYVQQFDGEAYVKGNTEIIRSNKLFRWIPWAFPFDPSIKGSVFEITNQIHFEAPNHFVITPTALRSSTSHSIKNQIDISPLLNLNAYEATSFNDKFLMPGSESARGIYEYRLDSTFYADGVYYQKIRFIPRRKNLKVIKGYLYIIKDTPYIAVMKAQGRLDIAKFQMTINFGKEYNDFMLPESMTIRIFYNILNNTSENAYLCRFKYNHIQVGSGLPTNDKKKNLDLTRYFSIKGKKVPIINDSAFWQEKRQFNLDLNERKLYHQRWIRDLALRSLNKTDSLHLKYQRVSEMLVSTSSFGKDENLQWSYSGLINPSMIGYSKLNGIVLRQRLFFNKDLKQSRRITFLPEIGFGFKQKELFYRLQTDWLYLPQKVGALSLSFKNGNKGFSSSFIDQVNHSLDSTNYQFDNLKIAYYHDYQAQLENSFELSNGWMLYGGIQYNLHKTVKKQQIENADFDELEYVKKKYADFVPYVRLEWTPQQYYRWIGKEKVYLPSPCPTFSLEFSKGIPNVMGADSRFNKVEIDLHQTIQFPKLRALSYRIGGGSFFNQKSEYFVDYRFFQRSNYPATWEDHLGGVFNLLDNRWYSASPQYAQLHLMYESPYILLHPFKRISKFVLSERLYLSQLYSPAKPSYTEFGYGLGNYIFNIAVFSNFHGSQFTEAGLRFSFELGRYW